MIKGKMYYLFNFILIEIKEITELLSEHEQQIKG